MAGCGAAAPASPASPSRSCARPPGRPQPGVCGQSLRPNARAGVRGVFSAGVGAEKWPAPPPEAVNNTLSSARRRRGRLRAQLGRPSIFTSHIGSVKQEVASHCCDLNSVNTGNLETRRELLASLGPPSRRAHRPIFLSDILLMKGPSFLGARREPALRIQLLCIARGTHDRGGKRPPPRISTEPPPSISTPDGAAAARPCHPGWRGGPREARQLLKRCPPGRWPRTRALGDPVGRV